MPKPYEIMERWAAGDWHHEPDGGTCSAIMEAYRAGIEAAAEVTDEMADSTWRETSSALIHASERIRALKE